MRFPAERDARHHHGPDYTMGWGSTMLGYADERIQRAVGEYLTATAPLSPFPDPLEMEVSEMIAEDFPSAEMVAFGKNGSDVCTVAARLARLATGKRQILSCGVMLPSLAHSEDVVGQTLQRLGLVLTVLSDAWRLNDFDRRIDIPLL